MFMPTRLTVSLAATVLILVLAGCGGGGGGDPVTPPAPPENAYEPGASTTLIDADESSTIEAYDPASGVLTIAGSATYGQ
jgi:hypothetical protein